MKTQTAEVVFVFPPAQGNVGAFKNHLGVAYLRTALAQKGIATVQYQNEHPGTIMAVASDILRYKPHIVGFTVYDSNFTLALALSREIKRQRPSVRVIFGGPTATFGAEQILQRHDVVDVCFLSEAEETGKQIFPTLLNNESLDNAQMGVAFRQDGKIICTGLAPLVCADRPDVQSALDATPSPYLSGTLSDGRLGVLTGRGCTHHCQYCCFAALGRKKLRLHSIDRVITELHYIAEHQRRTEERYMVAIHDDAFTLLPARAKALCQAIADRNLGLKLSCITRADAVDYELLRLMRDAGFVSLAFGLESAVPSVLRATGKVRPPDWPNPDLEPERRFLERIKASVIAAKKHGFKVGVSIILGLPTETAEDGTSTLRFVKELPIDLYMHNLLVAYPGTPLWENCDRYNIGRSFNSLGLPVTYKYAYDVTTLRPRPKCSLEDETQHIRLLVADALCACSARSAVDSEIRLVILYAPKLHDQTAAWLAQILGIGGLVVQVYPALKRSEETGRLYSDRMVLYEKLIPARHHVQLLPGHSNGKHQRWRIACWSIDLFVKHKPQLQFLAGQNGAGPLIDWIEGTRASCEWCEVCDYLDQPAELISFLEESGKDKIAQRLRRLPVPPRLKYPGRWFKGPAPCHSLTRIEIDSQGTIRSCHQGDPIGKVGDSRKKLVKRLKELAYAAEQRRGCGECSNTYCPRCPFPTISDGAYCNIMTEQSRALRLLNWIHVSSQLPLLLRNQLDALAND